MYYGFDIGGTKIALGVFDKDLKLQWETRVPTPRESYDEFLTAIAALVAQADERFGVKGSVGIGIPGMEKCAAPPLHSGLLLGGNADFHGHSGRLRHVLHHNGGLFLPHTAIHHLQRHLLLAGAF